MIRNGENMMKKEKISKKIRDNYVETLVNETIKDFKARQLERKPFEAQWLLNMNFLHGNQYCGIIKNDVEDYSKQYYWQEREVYNHIAAIVESRISRLGQIRPVMSVVPATTSEEDISTAKISKNLINSVYHKLNISDKIASCTQFSEVCGTGFYKIVWDSSKGKKIAVLDGEEICEGDVSVEVVSPFEIFPDSTSYEDIDDLMSIIHAKSYHVNTVKRIWGIDEVGEDIDVFSLDNIQSMGGFGYSASAMKVKPTMKHDQVLVIEKYCAPTKEFPNGRLIIVAGKTLVFDGELPYVNREDGKRGFPFVKQVSIKQPNSFFGTSVIERLIPVQRSYNAVKNRKHEYLNRLSMGVLTVEEGSVDCDSLEQDGLCPGKVLIYRQGSKAPQIMDNGSIPSDFRQEEEKLLEEFTQISGISDLLLTNSSALQSLSGVALELLLEKDSSRLNISSDQVKFAIKNIASLILKLYKQFVTTSRLAKVIGKDGTIEMFYFQKSDISSDDIVFQTETELGETKAQKRNLIFELLDKNLICDENGKLSARVRSKLLEMLGFGIWENKFDLEELHTKKAGKENLKLIKTHEIDDPVCVDNHNIHIDEHIAFLLSEEFSKNEQNGDIGKIMIEHINKHKKLAKEEKFDN